MITFAPMGKVKIKIDRESGRSLTDQLVDGLREAVRLGRWKVGEPIDLLADGLDGWETIGNRKSLVNRN